MNIRNYISLNFFSLKKSLKKIQYFIYLLLCVVQTLAGGVFIR